jgi:hypothetical protein
MKSSMSYFMEDYGMREITREMIKMYKIDKLGFDFMGYTFQRKGDLSFHHLIVPHRVCKELGIGEGYVLRNGAILTQATAHDYLHIIERVDPDMFYAITSEMLDENMLRSLEIANLKRIRDILLTFEKEHCSDTNKHGQYLIKPSFVEKRISLEKM